MVGLPSGSTFCMCKCMNRLKTDALQMIGTHFQRVDSLPFTVQVVHEIHDCCACSRPSHVLEGKG